MNSFLSTLAETIFSSHSKHLTDVCLVFPNRRASVFFQRELGKKSTKPILAPNCLTFEEFLEKVSGHTITEDLPIQFELFNAYRKTIDRNESFSNFLTWSSSLLSDIQDIEESNQPLSKIFNALDATKKMEQWNPENTAPSDLQKNFISFWEKLPSFYSSFQNALKKNNLFTRSSLEQLIASKEILLNESSFIKKQKHLYLCGFNALTQAETEIFKQLKSLEKTSIYWDLDSLYFDDRLHEAGMGPRRAVQALKLSNVKWVQNHFKANKKEIHIHGCPGALSQTYLLKQQLKKDAEILGEKSAIVLCDQQLAIPCLEAIPKEIEHINLSLGYPVKTSPIYIFWKLIIQLLVPTQQTNRLRYDHHTFLQLLQSEWFSRLASYKEIEQIKNHLINENLLFLTKEDLKSLNNYSNSKLLKELFSILSIGLEEKGNQLNLLPLQGQLSKKIEENPSQFTSLEKEIHYAFTHAFNSIYQNLKDLQISHSAENWKSLFDHVLSSLDIPILGEPLKGLQVLGLLETRNLDFENLYFLSVNEGTIPSSKTYDSLIPYDLRKQFLLPTYEQNDGIFANNFYRLIQRAKNVHLYFNSLSEGIGTGEKSRFISQMEHHPLLKEYIKTNEVISLPMADFSTQYIKIPNTENNQTEVITYLSKQGISPSAINTYLQNPLEFYLRYIKGIREESQLEEEAEFSTFGDIVHMLLEELYKPFVGEEIDRAELKKGLESVPSKCEALFKEKFGKTKQLTGKNLLLKNVVDKLVSDIAEIDLKSSKPIKIVGLELKIKQKRKIDGHEVIVKGIIDRVDQIGEQIRIIDYKTGKVEAKDLKVDSLTEIFDGFDYPKALQLLLYTYLYETSEYPKAKELTAGIISAKNLSAKVIPLTIDKNKMISHEIIEQTKKGLISILSEIANPQTGFVEQKEPPYIPFYAE